MVHGTNSTFRDAEKRSAIQNDDFNALFLNDIFRFDKSLYAHHSNGSRT
ncbi:hypothetical protein B1M_14466 [Burkholderia sp. TJI49]|nr:hypothetical protein B1M_14466 [Burkholderia sp. TJI49]